MVMPSPQQGQQPQQPQQQGQQQGQGQDDANKQQMFEQLAGPRLEYIYGNGLEDVKSVLNAGKDNPAEAIGDLVGKLMASSAIQARDNSASVPPDVMTATGMELINNVTDIAVQTGIITEQEANDVGEEAFIIAIGRFGQLAVDQAISQQEKQVYAQIVKEMQQLSEMKGGQQAQQPQQQPQQPQSMADAAV